MDEAQSFSISESYNYQALLDEAIETILTADGQLGSDEQSPDVPLEDLVLPLRNLKEADVYFAPALTIQRLSLQDFVERKLKPTPEIKKWLNTHQLCLVQVPATLKPAIGWSFKSLECGVTFKSVGSAEQPKIHDIYPDDVWAEVIRIKTHLTLGLNTALTFRAETGQEAETILQGLSGEAKARVSAKLDGGTQLVVGPFDTSIYRPLVVGRGRENSKVFWQFEGNDRVQREEPYLAVVLRVPEGVQEIEAQGRIIVYNKFDFFRWKLADWPERFREKLRSFFSNGIPLEATAIWKQRIG